MSKIEELTSAELELAEMKSGTAVTTLEDPKAPKMAMLRALAWVWKKREDPTFKYDATGKMTLVELIEVLGLDDEDPKES